MIFFALLLIAWAFLYPSVWARRQQDNLCFQACSYVSQIAHFNTTDPTTGVTCTGQACKCSNRLQLASLYLCNNIHCSTQERERELSNLNHTCVTESNKAVPPFSIIENYTDHDIAHIHRLQVHDVITTPHTVLNEVILPSDRLFRLTKDTLDAASYEREVHKQYGGAMYYFWLVVILFGLSSHLSCFFGRNQQSWQLVPESETFAEEGGGKEPTYRIPYTLLKRFLTIPATLGYTRSQPIRWYKIRWGTIPTRIQSTMIVAFIALNIVLCSVNYRVFEDNLYWPETSTQMLRYVADRTGVISTANLPLIWLFGIRNNTLLWLTGWDFSTYNNFHRWVARIATVEAVIHSVAYTVLIFKDETFAQGWASYVEYYSMWWFVAGVLATILMAAICGLSVYVLRRNFYEVFLVLHIILSVLVIVTMWYHVEIFNGEYNGYLWPCIFIWVFDRISRLFRFILFNPRFWNTKAVVTYDSNSNIVRLDVPYSTSFIKPRPGTFYYVTTLNDLMIWESHPFTLSYSTPEHDDCSLRSDPDSAGVTPTSRQDLSPSTPGTESDIFYESESLLKTDATIPPLSMVFIIRPYDGFTARLRDSASHGPTKTRVLIDGPYGETQPLHKYENVLFIVGGTGIAVPLSYLDVLLGEESSTTSLRIRWAVREHDFLAEAAAKHFRGALENHKISLTAYVTSKGEINDVEVADNPPRGLRIRSGRPDVYKEVEDAVLHSGHRPLAVVACGPGQMADDARKAVVNMLAKGYGRIEYFEESFNW